jgi:glycosyltransferase involved in cell wall biosynthesis
LWQAHESILSGANNAMLEYVTALSGKFRFFIILPHSGTMQQELTQRGIPYAIIHQYGWANQFSWWHIGKWVRVLLRSVVAVRQIRKLIIKERPAIVCTNTIVSFTASIAAMLQNIPHVWWIHEFGKEDFGFTPGWGHEKISMWWMEQSSKLIIGNSQAINVKFKKLMPKASVQTIYQPVTWNASLKIDSTKKAKFLMFGQIIASKGHKDVLKAMLVNKQQGKPLQELHIMGPCETESYLIELQNIVEIYGLKPYVQLLPGYFNKEEVLPRYEVLIVASKAEAFGRVIVEASKAGLRVVVRNSGGASELVNEGNGLLFNNQTELADVLCGDRALPETAIYLNYDESQEIQNLTDLLYTAC